MTFTKVDMLTLHPAIVQRGGRYREVMFNLKADGQVIATGCLTKPVQDRGKSFPSFNYFFEVASWDTNPETCSYVSTLTRERKC